jgi:hypothetical protein
MRVILFGSSAAKVSRLVLAIASLCAPLELDGPGPSYRHIFPCIPVASLASFSPFAYVGEHSHSCATDVDTDPPTMLLANALCASRLHDSRRSFVVGISDASIGSRSELWDVLCNMDDGSIRHSTAAEKILKQSAPIDLTFGAMLKYFALSGYAEEHLAQSLKVWCYWFEQAPQHMPDVTTWPPDALALYKPLHRSGVRDGAIPRRTGKEPRNGSQQYAHHSLATHFVVRCLEKGTAIVKPRMASG